MSNTNTFVTFLMWPKKVSHQHSESILLLDYLLTFIFRRTKKMRKTKKQAMRIKMMDETDIIIRCTAALLKYLDNSRCFQHWKHISRPRLVVCRFDFHSEKKFTIVGPRDRTWAQIRQQLTWPRIRFRSLLIHACWRGLSKYFTGI